jgi:hypothetical protein
MELDPEKVRAYAVGNFESKEQIGVLTSGLVAGVSARYINDFEYHRHLSIGDLITDIKTGQIAFIAIGDVTEYFSGNNYLFATEFIRSCSGYNTPIITGKGVLHLDNNEDCNTFISMLPEVGKKPGP